MPNIIKNYISESKFIVEDTPVKNSNILGHFTAVLSKIDEKTQNGTYYSEALWNSVLENDKFKDKLKKKLILGEIDHPSEPDTSIKRVSHAVTEVWKEGKELKGRCEVFATNNGKTLWTLLNAGVMLGVSSRALGDEEYTEGMRKIKPEGFDLIGWDVVVDASAIGAGFKEMSESKKRYVKESLSKNKDLITEEIMKKIDESEAIEKLNVIKMENANLKTIIESKDTGARKIQEQVDKLIGEKMKLEMKTKELDTLLTEQKTLVESKNKAILEAEQKLQAVTDRNTLLEKEITEKKVVLEKTKTELVEAQKQLTKKQVKYEVKISSDLSLEKGKQVQQESSNVISRNIKRSVGKQ